VFKVPLDDVPRRLGERVIQTFRDVIPDVFSIHHHGNHFAARSAVFNSGASYVCNIIRTRRDRTFTLLMIALRIPGENCEGPLRLGASGRLPSVPSLLRHLQSSGNESVNRVQTSTKDQNHQRGK
jgi:hypothetical protein